MEREQVKAGDTLTLAHGSKALGLIANVWNIRKNITVSLRNYLRIFLIMKEVRTRIKVNDSLEAGC